MMSKLILQELIRCFLATLLIKAATSISDSKEVVIARLYQTKVYDLFISHIWNTKYGWNSDLSDITEF